MRGKLALRLGGAAAAVALAAAMTPALAHASVFDDVSRDYTYMASEGFEVPEIIEEGMFSYKLVGVTEAVADPAWERPTIEISKSETLSIPAADLKRASGYFADELPYSQDGYEGTFVKQGVETSPEHEVLTRQVDRTVSYSGLPDNDVNRVPKTREFTVSAANGTQVKALALSDVTYKVESVDEWGLPTSYAATCNYRGEEEYLTTPGYTAVCTYGGTASLVDTQMIVTATYSWTVPYWMIALVAAVGLAAAAAVARFVYVLWWRKKRAIVWRIEGDKETLLERVKVAQTGSGRFQVDIPSDIRIDQMTEECFYEVEIPEKYLESSMTITQNELVLFDDVAKHRRIRVLNPFD